MSTIPGVAFAQPEPPANRQLIQAVRSGDSAAVRRALLSDADPDARDPRGWTPLIYAAMSGDVEIADALLRAGADVDAQTTDGSTPLMVAAVMGNTPLVRRLLAVGADATRRNAAGADARTKAEQYGHGDVVRLFEKRAASSRPAVPRTRESGGKPEIETASAQPVETGTQSPTAIPEVEPIDQDYVVLQGAIIRTRPVKSSRRIGAIGAQQNLRVVGKVIGKQWYEVAYGGERGYVYAKLLAPPEIPASPDTEPRDSELSGAESPVEAALIESDPIRSALIESPAIESLSIEAEKLVNGRWGRSGDSADCARDYLDVQLEPDRLVLAIPAAGDAGVVSKELPVRSIAGPRVTAGDGDLVWELVVTTQGLEYKVGTGLPVAYRRCDSSP